MARDYGRLHTAFWNSPAIRSCSDRGKLLAGYLLTGPHSNTIGAYLLPDAYIADDLGWDGRAVTAALKELTAAGFCDRFADGRHIVICKFLVWNPIENPNVGKAALRQLEQLPIDQAIQHVLDGLLSCEKQFPNGLETVLEQYRTTKPSTKPKHEPKPEPDTSAEPPALAPAIINLPTNRFKTSSEEVPVTQAQVDDYTATFPAVDVMQQLREMRCWLVDHPDRRKTANGMAKFINTWLSREQDKGTGSGRQTEQRSFAERKFDNLKRGAGQSAFVDGEPGAGVEGQADNLVRLAISGGT